MKRASPHGGCVMLALFAALVLGQTAAAGGGTKVGDWTIRPIGDGMHCAAMRPSGGSASLSLLAEGPGFQLLADAPDYPKQKRDYSAGLSFDGRAPVFAAALGDGGTIMIPIGPGEPITLVTTSKSLAVTVDGRTHRFQLSDVGPAFDALARCVGAPTLAERARAERPDEPIPGAGPWRLQTSLPGVTQRVCQARAAGDQIDTILMLNDKGELLLIGGHSDWASWGAQVQLQLSIDGTAAVSLKADTIRNLILTTVSDPALLERLREAKALDWTIPTGHVRGEVAGLGLALDAMKACRAGEAAHPQR